MIQGAKSNNLRNLIFSIPCVLLWSLLFLSPFQYDSTATELRYPVSEQETTLKQRYDQAKFYFHQLLTNEHLAAKKENWSKGARNFRQIYLNDPKSKQAPGCLFMLGRLYHKLYLEFDQEEYIFESIGYYKDTARLFPDHRLADDALLAIGKIHLSDHNDPKAASKQFTKIIQEYPSGDMHPTAREMMKQLSRDHDIALPGEMVGNSNLNKLNFVLPVKYWSSNNYTRVVIKASGPVQYREELLQKTTNKPRRLYIDFQQSYIEPQYRAPIPIEDGLLKQIRTGQFSKNTVRVVLDIESIEKYKIYSLPNPFRVVIDVHGKTSQLSPKQAELVANNSVANIKSSHKKHLADSIIVLSDRKKIKPSHEVSKNNFKIEEVPSTGNNSISLAQQLGLGVKRIVLDPGHGGKDPGATAFGLKEKNIVLKLAKQLKPILEKELNCEVILTRKSDTFLSLEERTAIANTKGADLFISLHINAHPSSEVRGIETYFLNLTTNAEAMRVAARENATSTHQMSDLQDILSDIMKNSKINESSRLADDIHSSILSGLTQNRSFGRVKNLGVKQAPFYVLIGAEMPAVLLEIAFISNPEDSRNLQSQLFIETFAEHVSAGIKSYIQKNSTASAQL